MNVRHVVYSQQRNTHIAFDHNATRRTCNDCMMIYRRGAWVAWRSPLPGLQVTGCWGRLSPAAWRCGPRCARTAPCDCRGSECITQHTKDRVEQQQLKVRTAFRAGKSPCVPSYTLSSCVLYTVSMCNIHCLLVYRPIHCTQFCSRLALLIPKVCCLPKQLN